MINFSGVYHVPDGMSAEEAQGILAAKKIAYKNPQYHVMTTGGFLVTDDEYGNDSSKLKRRLRMADLHFEPRGVIGYAYNMVVDTLLSPLEKLYEFQQQMQAKKQVL